MIVMNENMQYSISKSEDSKDKYYYGTVIKHLLFLNWINEINKGFTIYETWSLCWAKFTNT